MHQRNDPRLQVRTRFVSAVAITCSHCLDGLFPFPLFDVFVGKSVMKTMLAACEMRRSLFIQILAEQLLLPDDTLEMMGTTRNLLPNKYAAMVQTVYAHDLIDIANVTPVRENNLECPITDQRLVIPGRKSGQRAPAK